MEEEPHEHRFVLIHTWLTPDITLDILTLRIDGQVIAYSKGIDYQNTRNC